MTQRLLLVSQLAALCAAPAAVVAAQQRDTTARPADSLRVYTLPPAVVSVTRGNPPINRIPQAVQLVDKTEISRARPTWGLDEALATVPGVYAANRYNFSLDQRISIRGFGARSAFAVRGIKVLLDGIPQTLPDGQGQLTNLELGAADRIEVLRGSSSALFGNASGGVISIWSDPAAPRQVVQEIRFTGGTFDRHDLNVFSPYSDRTWYKWETSTQFRAGVVSRRGRGLRQRPARRQSRLPHRPGTGGQPRLGRGAQHHPARRQGRVAGTRRSDAAPHVRGWRRSHVHPIRAEAGPQESHHLRVHRPEPLGLWSALQPDSSRHAGRRRGAHHHGLRPATAAGRSAELRQQRGPAGQHGADPRPAGARDRSRSVRAGDAAGRPKAVRHRWPAVRLGQVRGGRSARHAE